MTLGDFYQGLYEYFASGQAGKGGVEVVQQLTRSIDDALAKCRSRADPARLPPAVAALLVSVPIQPATLAIPWQALRAAQAGELDPWLHAPQLGGILATAPVEYTSTLPSEFSRTLPHAGSLLSFMSELIFSAERTLLIVNPYWSIEGVKKLQLLQRDGAKAPPDVTIMTSVDEDVGNPAGLAMFVRWMESRGGSVTVYRPTELESGVTPLVHAKVMIADGERAYVGSANLSERGLMSSIEAGVALQGPAVAGLLYWFEGLQQHFE